MSNAPVSHHGPHPGITAAMAGLVGLYAQAALAADGQPPAVISPLARGVLSGEQAAGYASGLLVVFAVLGLLVFIARKLQGRGNFGRGGMRVLSSIGLGGKERLVMVDVEGERLLIGVAPGGVQLVRSLSAAATTPSPQRSPETPPAHRGNWLRRTLEREPSA